MIPPIAGGKNDFRNRFIHFVIAIVGGILKAIKWRRDVLSHIAPSD